MFGVPLHRHPPDEPAAVPHSPEFPHAIPFCPDTLGRCMERLSDMLGAYWEEFRRLT